MKTYFFSVIAISVCMAIGMDGYGQGNNIEKTYRWKYSVDQRASFSFSNYDCNLTIHTWDKPEIEYAMTVDASFKSEEDAARLDQYIEELDFSGSPDDLQFDNRFWSARVSAMGKKTITLKGGKIIRYTEFKMKGELWIPGHCLLHLNSKYSEIALEDLSGDIFLDLYNDKLFGENVNGRTKVAAKYCTLEFKNMQDIGADLYNTDMETGNIGNLDAVSKYSDIRVGDAGRVVISAYNDKYAFGNTGDLTFVDKYSDLKVGSAGQMELDCYNSTVHITKVDDVELKSKYGKYEVERVGRLNIPSAYNDSYRIGTLGMLDVTASKYSEFRIGYLESELLLQEGYSDKLEVSRTGAMKQVKINGKYVALDMAIDKSISYRFTANVKYGKFDINEESLNVKREIKDGQTTEIEAVRGVESNGMLSFFVNGYDMAVTLTDQR